MQKKKKKKKKINFDSFPFFFFFFFFVLLILCFQLSSCTEAISTYFRGVCCFYFFCKILKKCIAYNIGRVR